MNTTILITFITALTSLLVSIINIIFNVKKIQKEKNEDFKKEHYSRIVDSYLIFWTIFRYLSIKEGSNTSVFKQNENNSWVIVKNNAQKFIEELYDFFYSKNGIYLSRDLRIIIFTLRDELSDKIKEVEINEVEISNSTLKRFKSLRNKAIVQTRNEIGLRDIKLPTNQFELIDKIE